MTWHVHAFDAREGGSFRISLTHDTPTGTGKTTAHTDTYHGRFVRLVPDEQVVEVDEFETEDPSLLGEMTITITLVDVDGGTDLLAVHWRSSQRWSKGGNMSILALVIPCIACKGTLELQTSRDRPWTQIVGVQLVAGFTVRRTYHVSGGDLGRHSVGRESGGRRSEGSTG
jgi:hypothetical protein